MSTDAQKESKTGNTRNLRETMDKITKGINKLLALCMRENSRNKGTTFLHFCGHTECISFNYHKDGWKAGDDPDYSEEIYLTGILSGGEETILRKIAVATGVVETGVIPEVEEVA